MEKIMDCDFEAYQDISIVILTPLTEEAKKWVEEFLPDDKLYLGRGIAIEPRYIENVCYAIITDGLTIKKDNMNMILSEEGELCLVLV